MTEQRTDETRERLEIAHLMRNLGLSREYAERVMEDEDLWLLVPEQRFAFMEPAEDVRQWEAAYDFASALVNGFTDSKAINNATRQLLWEMSETAEEALRRARRRQEQRAKQS